MTSKSNKKMAKDRKTKRITFYDFFCLPNHRSPVERKTSSNKTDNSAVVSTNNSLPNKPICYNIVTDVNLIPNNVLNGNMKTALDTSDAGPSTRFTKTESVRRENSKPTPLVNIKPISPVQSIETSSLHSFQTLKDYLDFSSVTPTQIQSFQFKSPLSTTKNDQTMFSPLNNATDNNNNNNNKSFSNKEVFVTSPLSDDMKLDKRDMVLNPNRADRFGNINLPVIITPTEPDYDNLNMNVSYTNDYNYDGRIFNKNEELYDNKIEISNIPEVPIEMTKNNHLPKFNDQNQVLFQQPQFQHQQQRMQHQFNQSNSIPNKAATIHKITHDRNKYNASPRSMGSPSSLRGPVKFAPQQQYSNNTYTIGGNQYSPFINATYNGNHHNPPSTLLQQLSKQQQQQPNNFNIIQRSTSLEMNRYDYLPTKTRGSNSSLDNIQNRNITANYNKQIQFNRPEMEFTAY